MSQRRLSAIMFTDIVGYTQLMGSDEENAFRILDNNRKLHKELLERHSGKLLKELGDGMLCSFDSAFSAVNCGIELVNKSKEHKNLRLKIGIHVGEVTFSENDVFGDGVNIASRIEGIAGPDCVLVSGKVYDEIKNKSGIRVKSLGAVLLKNDNKEREIFAIINPGLSVPESFSIAGKPEVKPTDINSPAKESLGATGAPKERKLKFLNPKTMLTFLFFAMALVFGSFLFINFQNNRKVVWAEETLLPELERLTDSINTSSGIFGQRSNSFKAYELALEAEKYLTDNFRLNQLMEEVSNHKSIYTTPAGTNVFIRSYHDQKGEWKNIGITPIENVRFPKGMVVIKLVREGYETRTDAFRNVEWAIDVLEFEMLKAGSFPDGMVYCPGDTVRLKNSKFYIGPYYMDQYEVTNMEYKAFIKGGGYEKRDYWPETFIKNGKTISWEEARANFIDKTNQVGPSTWIAGDYPADKANHPVTGISWYEAYAYASFVGKHLPSYFHFDWVAMTGSSPDILPFANFSGEDSHAVGPGNGSMHRFNVYDLAGNAREWLSNTNPDTGGKLVAGGGWEDFDYTFSNNRNNAQDPFERGNTNGFRCITYLTDAEDKSDEAYNQLYAEQRGESKIARDVSDEEFKMILRNFDYDKLPLDTKVEYTEETDDWTKLKVTFNAAYGSERVIAYLFLPRKSKPPYQCVVVFPGTGARQFPVSDGHIRIDILDYLVKTGRAALFPVYKGMYERNEFFGNNNSNYPDGDHLWKDEAIMTAKDMKRSIDFLASRAEIDLDKLAYFGISWGGLMGGMMMSIEDRIDAGILVLGGLNFNPTGLPELDAHTYASRVTVPVLMLNGKYDQVFPYETSQKPLFDLLGTPADRKKIILYNEGHQVPRTEMIKESLKWLDTYFGPVEEVQSF